MLVMLWLIANAQAVECGEPVREEELAGAISMAESAFKELDDLGFRDGVNEAAGILLPCMSDAMSGELVGRYHRLMALHLFTIGDLENANRSLQAGFTSYPEYDWSDGLLPPSHDLRVAWDAMAPDTSTRTVPEPRSGSLAFDGEHSRKRPKNQPTIAQLFDESGMSVSTSYLGPREPLPHYVAIPRQRNMLLACAGGAAALSGTTYALGWRARGNMFSSASNPNLQADTLDSSRATANLMSFASGALFSVAAGCGVGAGWIGSR